MTHMILLAILLAAALFLAAKGVLYLSRNAWLSGFIRGLIGLGAMLLASFLVLIAWDLYSYRQLPHELPVGRIAFSKVAPQEFRVALTLGDEPTRVFQLRGDQWQLDARFIKMKPLLSRLGMSPLYRLERLNGRYFSLDDELNKPRSVHALVGGNWRIDTWQWIYSHHLPLVDATYGTAIYLPAEDGAEFELSLSDSGLIPRPLNSAARGAAQHLLQWE